VADRPGTIKPDRTRPGCNVIARSEATKQARADAAIAREKQIKAGSRRRKVTLIYSMNPDWRDLFDELP
jgi:putative endonuclease